MYDTIILILLTGFLLGLGVFEFIRVAQMNEKQRRLEDEEFEQW